MIANYVAVAVVILTAAVIVAAVGFLTYPRRR